ADDKKSSADEKARLANPNSRSKSGNDSRIDSSSSTTDTSNCSGILPGRLDSITRHCSIAGGASIVLWYGSSSDYRSRGAPLAPSGGALRKEIELRCRTEEGRYGCFYHPCFRK